MLLFLKKLLKTPSNFDQDPAGFLGNQAAHTLVVGGGLSFLIYESFSLNPWIVTLLVILVYAIWEAVQFKYGSTLSDSLEDTLYASLGSVLVMSGLTGDTLHFILAAGAFYFLTIVGLIRRL